MRILSLIICCCLIVAMQAQEQKEVLIIGTVHLVPKIVKNSYKPLLKEDLKLDAVLKTLTVIRQPNSTKYKVTQQQWLRVYELKSEG